MDLYNDSILIYSNHCPHSVKLYNILKDNNMTNKYKLLCIDVDSKTKKRPMRFYEIQKLLNVNITHVPTIIVDNAKYVLTGSEAFKFIQTFKQNIAVSKSNENVDLNIKNIEPMAFNPNEMGSTSDNYLNFGNIDNYHSAEVPKQNYQFLNDNFTIETPDEASFNGNVDYYKKISQRESFDTIVKNQTKGSQKQTKANKKNTKQMEFDEKYNKLLQDREVLDAKPVSRPKVDFTTGQINY
jgi:hypothetical protein